MRKGIICGMAVVLLLVITLLGSTQMALAKEQGIRVIVYARAKDGDIIVSGKVFLEGLEGGINVTVTITVTIRKPDDTSVIETFFIGGVTKNEGVTKLSYKHIINGCVDEKGIYEIEVEARCEDLIDTAFFKFDPPTGGTPGVPC